MVKDAMESVYSLLIVYGVGYSGYKEFSPTQAFPQSYDRSLAVRASTGVIKTCTLASYDLRKEISIRLSSQY